MIKFEQDIHQGKPLLTMADVAEWVERTHNSLIAAGCIQTLDTGQYVPVASADATVVQTLGYRIYELDDRYSNEHPVYFALTFDVALGSSAAGGIRFGRLTVRVGFETDGNGNFVGASFSKLLKTFVTTQNGAATYLEGARTFTSKGEDFLVHGNAVNSGFQSSNNIYESGFFAIVRSKVGGVINPDLITLIYTSGSPSPSASVPLRYVKLSKLYGVTSENSHIFKLPRVRSLEGLLVASTADVSGGGVLEDTDCLISFRYSVDDEAWEKYKLSLDGLSEKRYMRIPTSLTKSSSIINAGNICLPVIVDDAELANGSLGVLIGE